MLCYDFTCVFVYLQCCFAVAVNVVFNAVSLLFHTDFNAVPKAFYDIICFFRMFSTFPSCFQILFVLNCSFDFVINFIRLLLFLLSVHDSD